jgi:predicted anti-sigma-YlaC factor YlaD
MSPANGREEFMNLHRLGWALVGSGLALIGTFYLSGTWVDVGKSFIAVAAIGVGGYQVLKATLTSS